MNDTDWVLYLDTETTGLGEDRCIVEIGLLLIEYRKVFGPGWGAKTAFQKYERVSSRSWSHLIKAPVPVTSRAEEIHGISDLMLIDSPTLLEVADIIEMMLARAHYLVGQNMTFDLWMLWRDLPLLKWDRIPHMDTYLLQNEHGLDYGGSLQNCLSRGNVRLPPDSSIHRALSDAKLSAQLLEMISEQTMLQFPGLTVPYF